MTEINKDEIIENIKKLAVEKEEAQSLLNELESKIELLQTKNKKLSEKASNEIVEKQLSIFLQTKEIIDNTKIKKENFDLNVLIKLFDDYELFKQEIDSDKKLDTQSQQLKRLRTKRKSLLDELEKINNKLKALLFDCIVKNIELPEDITLIKNNL